MVQSKYVPITREYLRQFYAQHPMPPVSPDVDLYVSYVEDLHKSFGRSDSRAFSEVDMPIPTRIDDCFWRNRQFCEEICESLSKVNTATNVPEVQKFCNTCTVTLTKCERFIYYTQQHNTSQVTAQIKQFMPKDFRGQFLESRRTVSENKYQAQVDSLVKKGCTVRQKYELYLKQQWERREGLAQLGQMSGVFKFLVKHIGGIPDVLLDFAKQVNAKLGPLEEQRLKYGPDLYAVTKLGNVLNVLAALFSDDVTALSVLPQTTLDKVLNAVAIYISEIERIIGFIGDIFGRSPFFLTAEQASSGFVSRESGMHRSSTSVITPSSPEKESYWSAPSSFGSCSDEETEDQQL